MSNALLRSGTVVYKGHIDRLVIHQNTTMQCFHILYCHIYGYLSCAILGGNNTCDIA